MDLDCGPTVCMHAKINHLGQQPAVSNPYITKISGEKAIDTILYNYTGLSCIIKTSMN